MIDAIKIGGLALFYSCPECEERARIINEARARGKSWLRVVDALLEFERVKHLRNPPVD